MLAGLVPSEGSEGRVCSRPLPCLGDGVLPVCISKFNILIKDTGPT